MFIFSTDNLDAIEVVQLFLEFRRNKRAGKIQARVRDSGDEMGNSRLFGVLVYFSRFFRSEKVPEQGHTRLLCLQ